MNKTKIPMTGPVATRTLDGVNWEVSFFTPTSLYPAGMPVPVPTSPNVRIEPFPLTTFAIAEFGGEATEVDYKLANNLLKLALLQDGVTLAPADSPWAEVWCGYDAPFGECPGQKGVGVGGIPACTAACCHFPPSLPRPRPKTDLFNRHNEAWVRISL